MNNLIIFTIFLILPCILSETGYTQVRRDGIPRPAYQHQKKLDRMDTNAAIQKGRDKREAVNLARIQAANTCRYYSYNRNYYVPTYGYQSGSYYGYGTYYSPSARYTGRNIIIRTCR